MIKKLLNKLRKKQIKEAPKKSSSPGPEIRSTVYNSPTDSCNSSNDLLYQAAIFGILSADSAKSEEIKDEPKPQEANVEPEVNSTPDLESPSSSSNYNQPSDYGIPADTSGGLSSCGGSSHSCSAPSSCASCGSMY